MASDLPPEITEKILQHVWHSHLSPDERILFMTACPRLSRTWSSQYARIASTTIHVPCMNYLLYLAKIIRTRKSLIYDWKYFRTGARSIICFLDLRTTTLDYYSYTVWHIFAHMGNYIGLRTCFPSVQQLSFETAFLRIAAQPQIGHTQMAIIFDCNRPPSSRGICSQHGVHFNLTIYDPFCAGLSLSSGPWCLNGFWFLIYFTQIYRGVFDMKNPHQHREEHYPIRGWRQWISDRLVNGLRICGNYHICSSWSSVFSETVRMEDRMGINHYLWVVGMTAPREEVQTIYSEPGFFYGIFREIWNRLSYWSSILTIVGGAVINCEFVGPSYWPKFEVGSPHDNHDMRWWIIKYSDGRFEPTPPGIFLEERKRFLRV